MTCRGSAEISNGPSRKDSWFGHSRKGSDRGSLFTLCTRGLTDPAWPKYPRLPVLQCTGFEAGPLRIIFLDVADAPGARIVDSRQLGDDLLVTARPVR